MSAFLFGQNHAVSSSLAERGEGRASISFRILHRRSGAIVPYKRTGGQRNVSLRTYPFLLACPVARPLQGSGFERMLTRTL